MKNFPIGKFDLKMSLIGILILSIGIAIETWMHWSYGSLAGVVLAVIVIAILTARQNHQNIGAVKK